MGWIEKGAVGEAASFSPRGGKQRVFQPEVLPFLQLVTVHICHWLFESPLCFAACGLRHYELQMYQAPVFRGITQSASARSAEGGSYSVSVALADRELFVSALQLGLWYLNLAEKNCASEVLYLTCAVLIHDSVQQSGRSRDRETWDVQSSASSCPGLFFCGA